MVVDFRALFPRWNYFLQATAGTMKKLVARALTIFLCVMSIAIPVIVYTCYTLKTGIEFLTTTSNTENNCSRTQECRVENRLGLPVNKTEELQTLGREFQKVLQEIQAPRNCNEATALVCSHYDSNKALSCATDDVANVQLNSVLFQGAVSPARFIIAWHVQCSRTQWKSHGYIGI